MPGTVTTIDRGQREGLYELVRNHLGSIEDFFVALERTKDFARAGQLAVEFAEDFRLLQDIGWAERDERQTCLWRLNADRVGTGDPDLIYPGTIWCTDSKFPRHFSGDR
jgi:hypothetical protein